MSMDQGVGHPTFVWGVSADMRRMSSRSRSSGRSLLRSRYWRKGHFGMGCGLGCRKCNRPLRLHVAVMSHVGPGLKDESAVKADIMVTGHCTLCRGFPKDSAPEKKHVSIPSFIHYIYCSEFIGQEVD